MKISEPARKFSAEKQTLRYCIWAAPAPESLSTLSFYYSTSQPLDSTFEKGGETIKYSRFPDSSLFTKSINLS